jgi:hypothetical protein
VGIVEQSAKTALMALDRIQPAELPRNLSMSLRHLVVRI